MKTLLVIVSVVALGTSLAAGQGADPNGVVPFYSHSMYEQTRWSKLADLPPDLLRKIVLDHWTRFELLVRVAQQLGRHEPVPSQVVEALRTQPLRVPGRDFARLGIVAAIEDYVALQQTGLTRDEWLEAWYEAHGVYALSVLSVISRGRDLSLVEVAKERDQIAGPFLIDEFFQFGRSAPDDPLQLVWTIVDKISSSGQSSNVIFSYAPHLVELPRSTVTAAVLDAEAIARETLDDYRYNITAMLAIGVLGHFADDRLRLIPNNRLERSTRRYRAIVASGRGGGLVRAPNFFTWSGTDHGFPPHPTRQGPAAWGDEERREKPD